MFKYLKWTIVAGLLVVPMPPPLLGLVGPAPAEAQTICGWVGPVRVCRTQRPTQRRYRKRTTRRKSTRSSRSTRASIVRGDATLQAALNKLGFDAGRPDGKFGPQTRAAIRQFQKAYDQPVTGKLTQDQKDFLIAKYTGRDDDSGDDNRNRKTQRSADKFLVMLRGGDPGDDGSTDTLVLPGDDKADDNTDSRVADAVTLAAFCDDVRQQESVEITLESSRRSPSANPIPRRVLFRPGARPVRDRTAVFEAQGP